MSDSGGFSRRAVLAGSAATAATVAAAAAAGQAPASASAGGVTGMVPRGRTRVWQIGEQKSFDTLALVERPVPTPGRARR